MKFILALVIGISAGYFIGWKDAKMKEADSGVTTKRP